MQLLKNNLLSFKCVVLYYSKILITNFYVEQLVLAGAMHRTLICQWLQSISPGSFDDQSETAKPSAPRPLLESPSWVLLNLHLVQPEAE